jgi:hypothetical protein
MGWDVRPYWEAFVVAGEPPADYPIPALVEHGGAAPNGHTYVGLVPERGWGFAVLMNIFDEAEQDPFLHVEQGIQRILAGKEPLSLTLGLDPLGRNARATAILLLLLEIVSLSWSVRTLRHWRRPGTTRPAARRALGTLAAPLLLDVLVLWLLLIYVPARFETTLPAILAYQPDAPWIVMPLVLLAGLWGPSGRSRSAPCTSANVTAGGCRSVNLVNARVLAWRRAISRHPRRIGAGCRWRGEVLDPGASQVVESLTGETVPGA